MGTRPDDVDSRKRLAAFRQSLESLGWVEGKSIELNVRWASGNPEHALTHARELLRLNPEVILAHNTIVVDAFKQIGTSIPIVFVSVFDPIGSGFVQSIAKPGGNITGFSNHEFSMAAKWIEFAKDLKPDLRGVALMWSPVTAPFGGAFYATTFEPSASRIGLTAAAVQVKAVGEIEAVVVELGKSGKALIVMADPFLALHRKELIDAVARHKVVAVYPWGYFVRDGGLISYGVDQIDMFRRSASYVDRILRGEKPSTLPVQGPSKYEVSLNVKTAKALGITIPTDILGLADELIE
jgi:putative ABC transport system substrate-binding protein